MAKTSYATFTPPINGIHGSVHIWVGGTMSDAGVSPADPVFWLHHANLDRLWWEWYNSAQGNHENPPLVGSDAVMDPWTIHGSGRPKYRNAGVCIRLMALTRRGTPSATSSSSRHFSSGESSRGDLRAGPLGVCDPTPVS